MDHLLDWTTMREFSMIQWIGSLVIGLACHLDLMIAHTWADWHEGDEITTSHSNNCTLYSFYVIVLLAGEFLGWMDIMEF